MADPPKRTAAHDETPALIMDHPFVPRGEWWTLCETCGLAQAAHAETTVDAREEIRKAHTKAAIAYYADDNPEVFDE